MHAGESAAGTDCIGCAAALTATGRARSTLRPDKSIVLNPYRIKIVSGKGGTLTQKPVKLLWMDPIPAQPCRSVLVYTAQHLDMQLPSATVLPKQRHRGKKTNSK